MILYLFSSFYSVLLLLTNIIQLATPARHNFKYIWLPLNSQRFPVVYFSLEIYLGHSALIEFLRPALAGVVLLGWLPFVDDQDLPSFLLLLSPVVWTCLQSILTVVIVLQEERSYLVRILLLPLKMLEHRINKGMEG